MAEARILEEHVLYDRPGLFGAWPSIAITPEGELLVVFSGDRKNHVDPYGKTLLVRSADCGRSWSAPQIILNTPLDDRDPGILICSDGSWLVSLFTSRMFVDWVDQAVGYYGEDEVARWRPFIDRLTDEDFETYLGQFTIRSTDSGRTWSPLRRVPVHAPHGPIASSVGELLYLGVESSDKSSEIACYSSSDLGESWSLKGVLSDAGALQDVFLCEPHMAQLSDGKLLAQMRVNSADVEKRVLMQSLSEDGGKSWSPVESTGIWGLPPHLLQHSSGVVINSYGHRREPFGVRVALSPDGGKSWPEVLLLSEIDCRRGQLAEDVASKEDAKAIYYQVPDLGYPATVELADGSLYSVWYQSRPNAVGAVIMGCLWRLP